MIAIRAYNHTEQTIIVVYRGDKSYTYWCPEYWYRKLESWLRHKNYSRAAKFLKGLSNATNRT